MFHMNAFSIAGTINGIMFLFCLSGLIHQIKRIAKGLLHHQKHITKVLSLNQFSSSYLSFYGFFIFSFLISDINYFLFYTRLFACILTLLVVLLISIDRKNITSIVLFGMGVLSILFAIFLYNNKYEVGVIAKNGSIALILLSTVLLAQGGIHQILKIREQKSTGILSFWMNFVFFLKDMSNIGFAIVIGYQDGWPLFLMGLVSGLCKFFTLYHFFWVRKFNLVEEKAC